MLELTTREYTVLLKCLRDARRKYQLALTSGRATQDTVCMLGEQVAVLVELLNKARPNNNHNV